MKISGVVFDFGGVMTSCATPVRVKALVDKAGLPWQAVLDGFAAYRRAYDLGEISVREFYARVWRDAGVRVEASLSAAIEQADTESFLHPNEETLAWIRALKAQGFKFGVLTNMPHELAPHFRAHFAETLALADALIVSSEVRLVKPMPEIYAAMATRLALPPAELCFFDDAPVNCEGARAAGWQAIRFTTTPAAQEAFEKVLAQA
jgi:putative hydrolase of the HAD superfamily